MGKYPLIYIEWADSISNSAWKTVDEIKEWGETNSWLVRQVGWVVEENKRYLIIAGSWNQESEYQDEQFGGLQKIPKTWIRKRKRLNA